MNIEIQNTTLTRNGEEIFIFTLARDSGCSATITNYGAIVMAFTILTNENKKQDIVLGFEKVEDYWQEEYLKAYPYFGAVIGRTANRIKNGSFMLEGKQYQLQKNLGNDNLHSGPDGMDHQVWKMVDQGSQPNPFIRFEYTSNDMESGFPGNCTVTVTYTLLENELQYEISATTDAPTLFNPTQHTYFNLNEDWGSIKTHKVQLHSNQYLEQDESLCVTGNLLPVKDTIYDFSTYKHINRNWEEEKGYDQSYIIDREKSDNLALAAECWPMLRQCKLEIYTTAPIVHFYTGRWIPVVKGKYQTGYTAYSGLCFETQLHPNGINIANFPPAILQPGEQFYQKNSYKIVTVNTSTAAS